MWLIFKWLGFKAPKKEEINKGEVELAYENKFLVESDFIEAADLLQCDINIVKAITEVESSGTGFDKQGNLKLLFEPYQFYKQLKAHGYNVKELMKIYPQLITTKFNPKDLSYKRNQQEVLQEAIKIDEDSAFNAASYGLFQIMGFNYKNCGLDSAKSLYTYMMQSERNQLIAFCSFIKSNNKLWKAVKDKDFDNIARYYNGPKNIQDYSPKMVKAYKRLSNV